MINADDLQPSMDHGIKFTYVRVLKYGWAIKQTWFHRILYRLIKQYRYFIKGKFEFHDGACDICLKNRSDIKLPCAYVKEYSVGAVKYTDYNKHD